MRAPPPRIASYLLVAGTPLVCAPAMAQTQTAVIVEELRTLDTYPFSDPDPNPILIRDPRLYPYHAFDGYAHESEPRQWRVVRMENDHIVVFVLPEVGGKVWGAIEKSTGEEFIYRNETLKFRNIALRGPWTSGGIEFNFGVIGHTPATATPVDHVLEEHEDGSVSCTVGAMDLPSRTPWRVQIHLAADSACFETRALWYNPTPVRQAYYNWMTGAAFARDDLELVVPGDHYLEHGGRAHPWPRDAEGRTLSRYAENRFGGHKSFHVVGELADFFGGYYHDAGYGFGHWAPYDEMPGQKIWLWALSRQGGVWEDLLTDSDGQYVEFQAGRLLVQYAPGAQDNPIRQDGFEAYRTDRWTECWFPIKGLGGMSAASRRGVLHVERGEGSLTVGINSFQPVVGGLEVHSGGLAWLHPLELQPMEVHQVEVPVRDVDDFEVLVPELDLRYTARPLALSRPFVTEPQALAARSEIERRLAQGRELLEARRHAPARAEIEAVLALDPWQREALLVLADLQFRAAQYAQGLETVRKALQLDTYDAEANFLAGNLYRAAGDLGNAWESFGWAARSMAFRSAASTQMAEIALQQDDPRRAARHALRALDYDRHAVNALQVRAIAARAMGDQELAREALSRLLAVDPLHHFAHFERYLLEPSAEARARFTDQVGGEYPDQTYLELAIGYHGRGRDAEAIELLTPLSSSRDPLLGLWLAYLLRERGLVAPAAARSPAFVFPFRRETIPVLEWAAGHGEGWTLDYYLALNYWAVDRTDEALGLLDAAGTTPDHAPFYVARAHLAREIEQRDPELDLGRAMQVDRGHWRSSLLLVRYLLDSAAWGDAAALARRIRERSSGNFNVELALAQALLRGGALDDSIAILERVRVLPSEMGRTSRQLFEWAHLARALRRFRSGEDARAIADLERSLEWPTHLGQGRPYDPEERLQHFLLALAHRRRGEHSAANEYAGKVIEATRGRGPRGDVAHVLALRLHTAAGREPQVDELTRGLALAADGGDPAARWVLARTRGDEAELTALRGDHPALFDSFGFRLLEQALDLAAAWR